MNSTPLLSVQSLRVKFGGAGRLNHAVRDVSFDLEKGETLALVGESGSGKTVTALSILRLLPTESVSSSGKILLRGEDMLAADAARMRKVRGSTVGVVFQEPMTALNPLHTIGRQIAEVISLHRPLSKAEVRERVLELLSLVGIPDPEARRGSYPHQLSGGQRQRAMIAMALANEPDLLIADEPTTALDVTVQAQVMELLRDLQRRFHMAVLLITHDLGVVEGFSDRVVVMKNGEVMERAPTPDIFSRPQHPYTRMLLASGADLRPAPLPVGEPGEDATGRQDETPIVSARDVKVWFPVRRGILRRTVDHIRAVDGVSFDLAPGRCLGVVGESGSGKTTLGLAVLRLISCEGAVVFSGRDISALNQRELRPLRSDMQVVFQDPFGSLSPRMSVLEIVAEGLKLHDRGSAKEREQEVVRALTEVGLDPEARHRYPHEFSGGQRQRICIARALVLRPRLIVLDEPTSSLDRSVQFQVLSLLVELQKRHGLTYIFISHDLKVVRAISHDLLVMLRGEVVESGPAERVFSAPEHPYTRDLFRAAFGARPAVPSTVSSEE